MPLVGRSPDSSARAVRASVDVYLREIGKKPVPAMQVDDAPDLHKDAIAFCLIERGYEADRRDSIDHLTGACRLPASLLVQFHEPKEPSTRTRVARGHVGGRATTVPPEDPLDRALEWISEVSHVPDEGEPASWPKNPVDLRESAPALEPMKRLTDRHAVDALVRQRDRFCDSVAYVDGGTRGGEQRAHLRHGLDRNHVGSGPSELPCELPRSGPQIENLRGTVQVELGCQPGDCPRRVVWATPLIDVGGPAETLSRRQVWGHIPSVIGQLD
jgi:hypothetical protein